MNKIDFSSHATLHALIDERETERYSPPALSLDTNGYIQECDNTVEKLFGYRQHELLWQHISCLFPKFSEMDLLQGNRLNPMLSYICHCDYVFEAINKQSEIVICNLKFFLMEHKGVPNLRMIVRSIANANA
jgi:transcriptional regulator of aromatic amino acid metabolism